MAIKFFFFVKTLYLTCPGAAKQKRSAFGQRTSGQRGAGSARVSAGHEIL
jgi:hypothetical protein